MYFAELLPLGGPAYVRGWMSELWRGFKAHSRYEWMKIIATVVNVFRVLHINIIKVSSKCSTFYLPCLFSLAPKTVCSWLLSVSKWFPIVAVLWNAFVQAKNVNCKGKKNLFEQLHMIYYQQRILGTCFHVFSDMGSIIYATALAGKVNYFGIREYEVDVIG